MEAKKQIDNIKWIDLDIIILSRVWHIFNVIIKERTKTEERYYVDIFEEKELQPHKKITIHPQGWKVAVYKTYKTKVYTEYEYHPKLKKHGEKIARNVKNLYLYTAKIQLDFVIWQ